jgi:HSP20 family molecular chaperone IbpA
MTSESPAPPVGAREMTNRAKPLAQREAARPGPIFCPDVDIVEDAEEVRVHADLPGIESDAVSVRLEDGVLTIDAAPPVDTPQGTLVAGEFRSGGFHRRFALSDRIDAARISAQLVHGVLEVRLPKAEKHRVRQIPISPH